VDLGCRFRHYRVGSRHVLATDGHLTRAQYIALYSGVAIVTGLLFWQLCPGSTGELNLKQHGIRLTGAAGIGACFILLVYFLTKPEVNYTVVPVPFTIAQDFTIENLSPNDLSDVGKVCTISDSRYLLYAKFRPGHERGDIRIKHLEDGASVFSTSKYQITLDGELIDRVQSE
jgi:hypothetical protein